MLPSVSNKYVKTVADSVTLCGHTIGIQEHIIKGLDDKVYESQRDIWEVVPRGSGVYTYDGVAVARIMGLRKFGYAGAPYGYAAEATHAILIEKENGECAHISAFVAPDDKKPWWIAGSKNVHVAFPHDCDFALVEAAYTAERYKYALKIARVWHTMLKTLESALLLHSRTADLKVTLCGEAILADSEHIVAYEQKDILKFYAITEDTPSARGLTAYCPEEALGIFRAFGLPCAVISRPYKLGSAEYKEALEIVARRTNSEGVVVYGMNGCAKVCCLWKEKSYPYVMERVVREATINGKSLHQIRRRVAQRLGDHDDSLRAYFANWEASRFPWLLRFAAWLRLAGHIPAKNGWSVQSQWLTLQKTFQEVSDADVLEAVSATVAKSEHGSRDGPVVVMFVGLPGSGKSSAARGLYWLLRQAGYNPCWLNQDEAGANRYKYLEAIKAALGNPETSHILLDKSNLAAENRADYSNLGLTPTLVVEFTHSDGLDAYKAECAARFLARGAGHRSLRAEGEGAVDATKFQEICDSMLSKYTVPRAEGGKILKLDMRSWASAILTQIAVALDVEGDYDAAVAFSQQYERAVAAAGGKSRSYFGGISVRREDLAPVLASLPPSALEGKTLKSEFHITTRFLGDTMDPIWYLEQLDAVAAGKTASVHITELMWDAQCVAARVERSFACEGAHPHITLALSPKTKPVYSNMLLCSAGAESVGVDIVVTGKYFL